MNDSAFLTHFPGKLRYWAFHCTVNAVPSFVIALWVVDLWKYPAAWVAMISAILTFILLYSTLTSLFEPLSNERHVLSRALKLGTRIRSVISGLSFPLSMTPIFFILPDFWCGLYATGIVNQVSTELGHGYPFQVSEGTYPGAVSIYSATMVEGFILSGILLFISFIAVMVLQERDRRRHFEGAATH